MWSDVLGIRLVANLRRKLTAGAVAIAVGLALASCVIHAAPPHALATPDSTLPAAGTCELQSGAVATIVLNSDVPQPRCIQVFGGQRLQVVNGTSAGITVTFDSSDYPLEPGAKLTLDPPFGLMWQPGVHLLHTSLYGDSGPEIWLIGGGMSSSP